MRRRFGLISLASGLAAASPALSRPAALPLDQDALFGAALADPAASIGAPQRTGAVTTVASGERWIDTVRLTVAGREPGPAPGGAAPYRSGGYDLAYRRDWPSAWTFNAAGYGLGVSPHAGVGLSSAGNSAEAGAIVQFAGKAKGDRLGDLGVRDGKAFGEQSRWYMFAAVSGKSVGLNMTRNGGGDWRRAGWSTDPASKLVGDGQMGLGWRKGDVQAAFGYVHRQIKVQNAPRGADGGVTDSMAAFTLSIRPHR